MTDKPRAVVAMSGGVDSSVAAALLVEQGYDVIGLMMRLWSEPSPGDNGCNQHNRCCTPEAIEQARRVADILDIPFYVVDTQDVFRRQIVEFFIDQYVAGVTPNPCLECNRHIRWDFLLNKALSLGASHLATGHYARVQQTGDGEYQLLRAIDHHKDQSYVLHMLGQDKLRHALFPVGDYPKPEIREMAARYGLPTASREDSQDLCFFADNDYRRFLADHAPAGSITAGEIVDRSGQTLGMHNGLPNYTIGQRKGLEITASQPMYVIELQPEQNRLVVGPAAELEDTTLHANRVTWISGHVPPEPFRAQVKIRYRFRPAPALVTPVGPDRVTVTFEHPVRAISPGQGAVFYDGEVCLGGGIITR